VDLDRPNVARIYDYWLGGTTNWAADRVLGDQIAEQMPLTRKMALANRQFLNRAVAYLCRRGVRQFLDIGSGIPTAGNTHQAADVIAPGTRVVYVDNEPVAIAHAEELLDRTGDPARHAVVDADLRDPDDLWGKAVATGVLDPKQPIALLMIAVLHVVQPGLDGEDLSVRSVARYRELLAPGSFLVLSHATNDGVPAPNAAEFEQVVAMFGRSGIRVVFRSRREIQEFMGEFAPVEPGMVWAPQWHPDEQTGGFVQDVAFDDPSKSVLWVGVGTKT
jgi:SAM-dependent methyltransferase